MNIIYKRGTIWYYDFSLKKKRYRGSCRTEKKALAEQYANNVWLEAYNNIILNIKNPTFAECANFFNKNNSNYMNTLSKSTQYQFKNTIALAIAFFNQASLTPEGILQFFNHIQNLKKLSNRTICKHIDVLNSVFKFCKTHNIINENPLHNADLTIYKKAKSKTRVRYLEKQEYVALLASCHKLSPNIVPYVQFAVETGLRLMEQLDLSYNAVDWQNNHIYITKTKTYTPRVVPLSTLAFKVLKQQRKENKLKPFPMHPSTLHGLWVKVLADAQISSFHWHDLRHTFASWAVKGWHPWQTKPMDLYKVAKWLGHGDVKMTTKYAHLNIDDLKNEITTKE